MKSAFIIRFHYPEGDPRFAWRLRYFKDEVLPRILEQTDQDFDIAIRCRPEDDNIFRSLSEKIRTFHVRNESERYKIIHGKRYFLDFVSWKDVEDLPRYDLQMGLDSDDLIRNDYVERIKKEIGSGGRSTHVCFQPELLDLKTGRILPIHQNYHEKKGSAFFGLYQSPAVTDYHFAYEKGHLDLWQFAEKSIVVPEGYCWATAHDLNESTRAPKDL